MLRNDDRDERVGDDDPDAPVSALEERNAAERDQEVTQELLRQAAVEEHAERTRGFRPSRGKL